MKEIITKLEKLNRAIMELNKIHDVEKIYQLILDHLKELFNFQSGAILLLEKDGETLTIKASRGYDPETTKNFIGKRSVGITGLALEKGEPILVKDVKKEKRYIEGVKGASSELAAPLIVNGETIGVLDIESKNSSVFNELDFQLFSSYTSQAASALKSTIFISEIGQKAKRLEILHKAAQLLMLEHDPDIIIEKILELARAALNFSRCALLLIEKEKEKEKYLKIKSSIGYEKDVEKLRIKIGEGITGRCAKTGRPILVSDVTKDPDYIPGVSGAKCEICAPLIIKGETIGVIDAEATEPGAFGQGELELLSVFASHAASAIHNARLFNQLERANATLASNLTEMAKLNKELDAYARQISETNQMLQNQIKRLTTLHKAGLTITSSLDLDTTLEKIVEMIKDIVEASTTTIRLIDRETSELKIRVKVGDEEKVEKVSKFDFPLKVGQKTIGVFELASERNLDEDEKKLLETLATQAAVAIENATLFEETQKTYYETLKSLAAALEARDAYTRGHSERVAHLALKIAEKLGIEAEERKEIHSVALLHDIGKIGVRDEILLKPKQLSESEWNIIKNHPVFGDAILAPLRFLSKVAGMVKHHHERWDGNGYPNGLKGKQIPLASRIVAAADAYDALTSDRPYRSKKTKEEALQIIKEQAGKQFDPSIVEVLVECIQEVEIKGPKSQS